MFTLRNKLDRKTAKQKLQIESVPRRTVSFYTYTHIAHPRALRDELFRAWSVLGVLGRIYLAAEGINAQCSVPEKHWDMFVQHVHSFSGFKHVPFKIAVEEPRFSFIKLCIKVRKQIVADGLTADDYDLSNIGTHLTPEAFHDAMDDPNTIVVDMRNHYESRIGHFEGAIIPDCDTFREELPMVKELLADKKDKKILLYCTGGIRCEKASAYLKNEGFEDVNQLLGGIIDYAHTVKEKGLVSKFKGKNYVFDDRIAEAVTEDVLSSCDQCGDVCDEFTNCRNVACNLLFIQCPTCQEEMHGCCTDRCVEIIALPEEEYTAYRKQVGSTNSALFKSRQRPDLKRHTTA